jgi:hypothetical protein
MKSRKIFLWVIIFFSAVLVGYWITQASTSTLSDTVITCTDSDGGKNIYAAGNAITRSGSKVLHISSDSCATHVGNASPSQAQYVEGLAACSGENCYVAEGYCGNYQDSPIDGRQFIRCLYGCNKGSCISK